VTMEDNKYILIDKVTMEDIKKFYLFSSILKLLN